MAMRWSMTSSPHDRSHHCLSVETCPGCTSRANFWARLRYEEAAALGLLAGINAVCCLQGRDPFIPGREDAYLGVLLDDVSGREHREPYRMFTSRAEHRLLLVLSIQHANA